MRDHNDHGIENFFSLDPTTNDGEVHDVVSHGVDPDFEHLETNDILQIESE